MKASCVITFNGFVPVFVAPSLPVPVLSAVPSFESSLPLPSESFFSSPSLAAPDLSESFSLSAFWSPKLLKSFFSSASSSDFSPEGTLLSPSLSVSVFVIILLGYVVPNIGAIYRMRQGFMIPFYMVGVYGIYSFIELINKKT